MFWSFLFSKRNSKLTGRWVDASVASGAAGFFLGTGGAAKSLDASWPQYTAWRRSGDTLMLWGRVLRGDEHIDFIESLHIHKLTDDELILGRSDDTFEYRRDA